MYQQKVSKRFIVTELVVIRSEQRLHRAPGGTGPTQATPSTTRSRYLKPAVQML